MLLSDLIGIIKLKGEFCKKFRIRLYNIDMYAITLKEKWSHFDLKS